MAKSENTRPSFNNVFNLLTDDLKRLEIKEIYNKDSCLIKEKDNDRIYYNTFILDENSRTRIHCVVNFFRSSQTDKYIPRLTFKKTDLYNNERSVGANNPVNIAFNDSEQSIVFWKFISFLNNFKEIVDLGEFEKSYHVVSKNSYFLEFENKNENVYSGAN